MNNTRNIVLKNIAGQCINETKLQTFNFGANINICEAPQSLTAHTLNR